MVALAVRGVVGRPIHPEAPCTGHVRRVMAAAYVASDHAGDAVTDEELTCARKGDACNLPPVQESERRGGHDATAHRYGAVTRHLARRRAPRVDVHLRSACWA